MEIKKRYPVISVLFSIISPGLGQIYNGQLGKGIIYAVVGLVLLFLLKITGVYFYGLVISLFLLIGWVIFVIIDSLITSIKIKQIKLNKYNKWYVYLLFAAIITVISSVPEPFLTDIKAYSIPASSMQPTFLIGDYLISDNSAYGWKNPLSSKSRLFLKKPERGDVVTFIFPEDPSKEYIKRIIGLPGDRVQIIDKKVYINNKPYEVAQACFLDHKFIPADQSTRDNYGPVVVPRDSYFVLGDNRDWSYDSRFWGFVPFDLIQGKARYIYFSWDKKNSRVRWERLGLSLN